MEALVSGKKMLDSKQYSATDLKKVGIQLKQDGTKRTAYQLLSFPEISFEDLVAVNEELSEIDEDTRDQLSKDALYANYIERQQRDVDAMKRDENLLISQDFDYQPLDGLSNELKAKLQAARPQNLAQAARVDGMTPAAITLLLAKMRQVQKEKSA
jgi:tRNA uridine 5-carboxymethylaminomethyl modification enzyme